MKKKVKNHDIFSEEIDSFYVSWGDMVTLLLVLFVFLFSISEIDYIKFLEASQSIKTGLDMQRDITTNILSRVRFEQHTLKQMQHILENFITKESLHELFEVKFVDDHLELNLGNLLLFDTGEALLKQRAKYVLRKVAEVFDMTKGNIVVEGHSDNRPIATYRYPSNWELSSARSSAVVRYLSKAGVNETRFVVMAFAYYRPVAENDSPKQRQKNRRVRIILKPEDYNNIIKKIKQEAQK